MVLVPHALEKAESHPTQCRRSLPLDFIYKTLTSTGSLEESGGAGHEGKRRTGDGDRLKHPRLNSPDVLRVKEGQAVQSRAGLGQVGQGVAGLPAPGQIAAKLEQKK